MNNSVQSKIVVITGASSGIGEATAYKLAAKGLTVVLGARRIEKLESIASSIRDQGGKAEVLKTDVTQKKEVQNLLNFAVEKFGRVDVLVNNAGIMSMAPMNECRTEEWDRMIDVNVKGVLYGVAAALPIFKKQESGHFINLASVAGIKVLSPGGAVYSGTKFAVKAITEGLRHEVGESIRTTTIEPGAIDTDIKFGTSHEDSAQIINEFMKISLPASSVADTIAYAIEQPENVDINEIVLRPTTQEF